MPRPAGTPSMPLGRLLPKTEKSLSPTKDGSSNPKIHSYFSKSNKQYPNFELSTGKTFPGLLGNAA